jgi:hypothetical protein
MIVIRNRDHSLAFTARANAADLRNGMVVKFSGVTANGTPQVQRATTADLTDASIQKGIVWYRGKDDTEVDFEMDATGVTMTAIAKVIPQDAQVTVYTGKMVVAYHSSLIPAGLQNAAALAKVAIDSTTSFPALWVNAGANGTGTSVGFLERKDGPETTLVLSL